MKNLKEFEERDYSEELSQEIPNSESTEFEVVSQDNENNDYSEEDYQGGQEFNDYAPSDNYEDFSDQDDSGWEEDSNPKDDSNWEDDSEEPYYPEENWNSSDNEEEDEEYNDPKPSSSGNSKILSFEDYFNRD